MEPSVLGQRVAEARKANHLTQGKLAELAQIAVNTVARLEQGHLQQIRTDNLLAIARALNISTDYLLGHNVISGDGSAASDRQPLGRR